MSGTRIRLLSNIYSFNNPHLDAEVIELYSLIIVKVLSAV